jgi:CTP:molybdopterin cytidylyltransferase MocA
MNPASTGALVLAAGFSERMGEFKPLMTLGGHTLLERAVRLFQAAGVGRIHVVLGHRAADAIPIVERLGARATVNPGYAEGMYSSVRAGTAALDAVVESFFCLPVDIPLVRPATLRALLQTSPGGGSAVCHPTFAERRGHPPLIGSRHIPAILEFGGEGGLAAVLRSLEPHAIDVPVIDEFIHADMDRPCDYRRLAGRLASRDSFTPKECRELLENRLRVPMPVAAHGRAVADAAVSVGCALNRAGYALDLHLIEAAALVHDLARGRPDHARCGAHLLRELGMPRMAAIVETHMELSTSAPLTITEAEIVFLADKLVQEDRWVGLSARFAQRRERFPAGSPAAESLRARMALAERLAADIEAAIGRPLEQLHSEGSDRPGRLSQ